MDLEDRFQRAIHHENRHCLVEAEMDYQWIYEQIINGHVEVKRIHLVRVATFFYRQKKKQQAYEIVKRSFHDYPSDEQLGSLFLQCWRELSRPLDELKWFHSCMTFHSSSLAHIQLLWELTYAGVDVYQQVLSVVEEVELHFFEQSEYFATHYVDLLRLLVQLEVQQSQIPQARFFLRKWMCLESSFLQFENEMMVWSIFLDETSILKERKDSWKIKSRCNEETRLFLSFIEQLENDTERVDDDWIQSYRFEHPLLVKKQQSYRQLVDAIKCSKPIPQDEVILTDWTSLQAYILSAGIHAYSFFCSVFHHHADLPSAIQMYQMLNDVHKPLFQQPQASVKVTVIGGGDQVGGSSILLSVNHHHLLIDSGLVVNGELESPDFSILEERGIHFDQIDALIVTHAHLDHCGAVPEIYHQNPHLPIYTSNETKQLMRMMLKATERSRRVKNVDLEAILAQIQVKEGTFFIPSKGQSWKITFLEAGHILGAISLLIEIEGTRIFVTGDYSLTDQFTVKGLQLPTDLRADIVITESTYGWQPMRSIPRQQQIHLFIQQMKQVINRGGSVLIPAFALGRAQEIICLFRAWFDEIQSIPFPVYLDGMVSEITQLYESLLLQKGHAHRLVGSGVHYAKDLIDSLDSEELWLQSVATGGCCVIASSGMLLEGSTSFKYAQALMDDARHGIAFTGYLDEESPGRYLQQSKKLWVNGKWQECQAECFNYRLSAHVSIEEILQTVLHVNPHTVLLVHGDSKSMASFPNTVLSPFRNIEELLKITGKQVISTKNGVTYRLFGGYRNGIKNV
ncbi:MBL fold metallo-hydrolase [Hazenella coriacea]|uniref:Cft2 family RNA processing exonuclease n=1 Tax=Hazenella coriacea TaxID=1179467 RepID=A0A4R3LHF0_9BACL|nr:MBL fold metallo-hydrolase [Hazenella coriacea]TCS96946.1 Cft2 family RNA processing exonuclease [Hazenella coriacea]